MHQTPLMKQMKPVSCLLYNLILCFSDCNYSKSNWYEIISDRRLDSAEQKI